MNAKLPESRQKQIFLELVTDRSRRPDLGAAQVAVAERHGLSLDTVRAIERTGMIRDWPPLD